MGEDYSGDGAAAGGAFLGPQTDVYKVVIASLAIGITDAGGIYPLQHLGLLLQPSSLEAWACAGLILWVAAVGTGLYRCGIRALWSLIGLPLVLFPFVVIVVGAGMI